MGDLFSTKVETPPLLTFLNGKKDLRATLNTVGRQMQRTGSQSSRSLMRYQSVQATVRTLQLDHTQPVWSFVSYTVATLLLMVVPIFQLVFVESDTDLRIHQLVFQPVVVAIGVSRSIVSFVFLTHAIKMHGLQGLLSLVSVADEVAQVRKDYDAIIERGSKLLLEIFVPSFVLYIVQLIWLYNEVGLKPLPFGTYNRKLDMGFVVVMMTLSWIFQTTTYLYVCVLFWKVCKLQESKMRQYYGMLLHGLETEYYVLEYERIREDLKSTSQRFRIFLAFTGVISVTGALISMYEVVDSFNAGFPLCLWGDLLVLTVVNVTGSSLCLGCASKIAHLHQRIVKRACYVHAQKTLENPMTMLSAPAPKNSFMAQSAPAPKNSSMAQLASAPKNSSMVPSALAPKKSSSIGQCPSLSKISEYGGGNQAILHKLETYCNRQEAWARRAAVVDFLANGETGISIYGFILDRFFVLTSVGAVLTTTWFLLGRSFQG